MRLAFSGGMLHGSCRSGPPKDYGVASPFAYPINLISKTLSWPFSFVFFVSFVFPTRPPCYRRLPAAWLDSKRLQTVPGAVQLTTKSTKFEERGWP
jgi:hypothetical protein